MSFHINSFYSSQLRDVFMYPTPDFEATSTPATTVCELFGSNQETLRFKTSLYGHYAVV